MVALQQSRQRTKNRTSFLKVTVIISAFGSAAEKARASFLQTIFRFLRFYCLTRTLVTLWRPWMRRFTIIISAWCLRTSSKFSGQEFEEIHQYIGSLETPKQVQSCKSGRAFPIGFGPNVDNNFGANSGLKRTFCLRCTKI